MRDVIPQHPDQDQGGCHAGQDKPLALDVEDMQLLGENVPCRLPATARDRRCGGRMRRTGRPALRAGEAQRRTGARLLGFDLAVARRRRCDQ